MYPCQKCSACCRLVGRVVLGEKMADADGVCHFLDRTTNLCTQYENRPLIVTKTASRFGKLFCTLDKSQKCCIIKTDKELADRRLALILKFG